jgi:hypothetical protein
MAFIVSMCRRYEVQVADPLTTLPQRTHLLTFDELQCKLNRYFKTMKRVAYTFLYDYKWEIWVEWIVVNA